MSVESAEGYAGRPEPRLVSEGLRLLGALRRRRSLLAGSVAAALLLATLYNETARPLYRAVATLDLAPDAADAGARARLPTEDDLFRVSAVLRSWGLAQRIVRDADPRLARELSEGALLPTGGRFFDEWANLARRLAARVRGEGRREPASPGGPAAVDAFLSRLSIAGTRRSFVSVAFLSYDAEVAALAVNALVDVYITEAQRTRGEALARQQDVLAGQLAEQRKKAEDAQGGLQRYETEQGLANLEERQRMASQRLAQASTALDQARTARLTKEALRREMAGLAPEALADFPPLRSRPSVGEALAGLANARREHARLSKSLGERHPDLLAAEEEVHSAARILDEELRRALLAFDSELSAMRAEEETLRTAVDEAEQELKQTREKAVEYGLIKRDSEATEQLLKDLMSRTKGASLASGAPQLLPARVTERARPPAEPSSPRRDRNYRAALLAGLVLGLLLVFVTESFDDSVKIPDDLDGHVDVPFLGLVPEARMVSKARSAATPLIHLNPSEPLQEAYRIVRTNLLYAGSGTARTLLVSSVGPSEGKSTSVVNLALSLAANGARVLVVDADLRRPSLHTKLAVPAAPGLSDLLLENAPLEQAIRPGIFERVDIIPCGRAASGAAEILGRSRMRELLREWRTRYDWVLIDGPPILAIADASILCGGADGVLLVIAAERCPRNGVQRAVAQVRSVGGTVVGALLNRVDFERNPYYYGHYYGDYYRSYYRADAKQRDEAKPAQLT